MHIASELCLNCFPARQNLTAVDSQTYELLYLVTQVQSVRKERGFPSPRFHALDDMKIRPSGGPLLESLSKGQDLSQAFQWLATVFRAEVNHHSHPVPSDPDSVLSNKTMRQDKRKLHYQSVVCLFLFCLFLPTSPSRERSNLPLAHS
jgi:hypothetical protein